MGGVMSLQPEPIPSVPDAESYQRLKSEYDRLRLLYQVSQELNSTFNLQQVLQQVLLTTTAATGATRGSIMLFDEHGSVQQHLLTHTFHESPPSPFTNRVVREGLAGWVLQHNQSVLISDTAKDARWIDYPGEIIDVRSAIASPLNRGRRVRGVLTLVHPEPDFFHEDDHDLLNAIAHHAALAIENARLIADINDERRKFEGAVTAMEEGLILVDNEGILRYANPQALSFLSVSAPVPTRLAEISAELTVLLQEAQTNGENIRTELSLLGPPRLDLSVNIAYMPILSEQADWWTILLHDVTRLKDVDRLKTQFVANASHELRTPLANIKLYARLAEQGRPERRDEYLRTIASEASRLEELVEDLLTLTRLDSHMVRCYLQPTQLDELLENVIPTYQPLAEARGLTLALDLPSDPLPIVEVDPDQFTRVIVNLVSNAFKFTPTGGQITISVHEQTEHDMPGVAVQVQDNGIGISPQDQAQLFERFFRGANVIAGGTGLGLTIVRELMGLMHGSISVESSLGKGSTFTCWLPQLTSATLASR